MKLKYDKTLNRYYHTFTYEEDMEIRIPQLTDCIGDTKLTNLQLEKSSKPTRFVPPTVKPTMLSGVFKLVSELRNGVNVKSEELSNKIENQNSNLTNQIIQQNINLNNLIERNSSMIRQTVSQLSDEVLRKAEVKITKDGVQLGAGKKIDGDTLATLMIVKPESIEAITKLMRITGDLIVGGTIEGKHIKAGSIDTGELAAGAVTASKIMSDAINSRHLKVDNAMIDKLATNELLARKIVASNIFTSKLDAIEIDTTWIRAYQGEIGGFQLGFHSHDKSWGRWLTGRNSFKIGLSNGEGGNEQTALWVNWGNNWGYPGNNAWYVLNDGRFYCNNSAKFSSGVSFMDGNVYFNKGFFYKGKTLENWLGIGADVVKSNNVRAIEVNWQEGAYWAYWRGKSGTDHYVKVTKSASDKRYKHDIRESNISALDKILQIGTYSYSVKFPNQIAYKRELGIMAQDIAEHIPDAHEVQPDGIQSYKPFELVPYLMKAIQELNEKIEVLENGK